MTLKGYAKHGVVVRPDGAGGIVLGLASGGGRQIAAVTLTVAQFDEVVTMLRGAAVASRSVPTQREGDQS